MIERKKTRSLLYAVYRVRCNFFHGNKRLGDPTDRLFIASASIIIRNYLGTLNFLPNVPEHINQLLRQYEASSF